MLIARTTNRDSASHVERRIEFNGSNLFARYHDDNDGNADMLYAVYSYGYHWPLLVYDCQVSKWFRNSSRYGVTTSKHATQVGQRDAEPVPLQMIRKIIWAGGVVNATALRLAAAARGTLIEIASFPQNFTGQ